MKIQALILRDEFLYACITEICHKSIETSILPSSAYPWACLPKIASSVWTSENYLDLGKVSKYILYIQMVFTFWMILVFICLCACKLYSSLCVNASQLWQISACLWSYHLLINGQYVDFYYKKRCWQVAASRSSGQSSWLQIQRSRFDCRRYQTFWEMVGLEGGPRSESASKLYRSSDRHLSAKLVPTVDRGCHVVSDRSLRPYFRISRSEPLLFL
jgi:hypothetical protein